MFDISNHIISRLKSSNYWTDKTRVGNNSISGLICPECGSNEAWAYSKRPFTILCTRLNNCGARIKIKSLFPDLFTNIEKEYKPIKNDPHRPAKVFLKMRGLHKSIDGLDFEYWPNVRGSGSGAVMFPVKCDQGTIRHNGRLFNPPAGEGKTHNQGKLAHAFWKHPNIKLDFYKDIYVTEGIIDALSLIEMGYQAIAVLSTGRDPSRLGISGYPKLIFAFDNDQAGHKALKKWKEAYPHHEQAIMCSPGQDWNDLLLASTPEKAREQFEQNCKRYRTNALLAITEKASDYAQIYFDSYGHIPGLFAFNGCYYWSYAKKSKNDVEINTQQVSNFTLDVDHFQLNTLNQDEPTNRYHLIIKPQKGRQIKCTLSANELSSPNSLTTTFLQKARQLWSGEKQPSMALIKKIVESGAPVVRQLQTSGFDKESDSYIFQHFLINPNGNMLNPNKKGFFEINRQIAVRPARYPTIKPIKGVSPKEIYNLINQAWPDRGALAISWMVASWFVNQIKSTIGFFPFLSFYGDTQVGKTRLTRILNALQCHDEEGLPMRKVNTAKGEIRKLAQRSGLFKALLESNSGDSAKLDFENILTWYNDAPLQTRATKTNDVQTQDIPFLSSLLFVQNREPFKTKAQKERVISLNFKSDQLTEDSTNAFDRLVQISVGEIAYFYPFIMKHRSKIESEWRGLFEAKKKELIEIGDARIIENHAIILAFHEFISEILGIKFDLKPYVESIGINKREQCISRQENTADLFFDCLLNLQGDCNPFLHTIEDQEETWINLAGALSAIKKEGFLVNFNSTDLSRCLQEHPAYKKNSEIHRFKYFDGQNSITQRKRAWLFDMNIITGFTAVSPVTVV